MYPTSHTYLSYAFDSAGESLSVALLQCAFPLDVVTPDESPRLRSRKHSPCNSFPHSVDHVCAASSSELPWMDIGVNATILLFQTRLLARFSLMPRGAHGTTGPGDASSNWTDEVQLVSRMCGPLLVPVSAPNFSIASLGTAFATARQFHFLLKELGETLYCSWLIPQGWPWNTQERVLCIVLLFIT